MYIVKKILSVSKENIMILAAKDDKEQRFEIPFNRVKYWYYTDDLGNTHAHEFREGARFQTKKEKDLLYFIFL